MPDIIFTDIKTKKFNHNIIDKTPTLLIPICILSTLSIHLTISYLTTHNLLSDTPIASPFFAKPAINNYILLIHILLSIPPCVVGPLLFHKPIRKRHLNMHRLCGKIYVLCCLCAAFTALPLAFAQSSITAATGITTMTSLWAMTTWLSYTSIRAKDIIAHRKWIIRSYSLTMAFISGKIWLYVMNEFTILNELTQKDIKSWAGWITCLIIAEIWLRSTNNGGVWKGFISRKVAPRAGFEPATK